MALVKINNNVDIHCPSGSHISPIFSAVFDEKLKKDVIKKTGEFDIYEFIQASANNTDLALLREQMISTGQIPIIDDDVVQDAALMPQNIHELYDVVNSVQSRFNELPDSVKSCFKDSDDFLQALTSGTYQTRLQKHFDELIAVAAKAAEGDSAAIKKEGE